MVQVIDSFKESKTGNPDGGQDHIAVLDNYITLIDGVTPLSGETTRIEIENIISTLKTIPADTTLETFLNTVHKKFIGLPPRVGAVCAIYSINLKEIWLIGDTIAIVNGAVHPGFEGDYGLDTLVAATRKMFAEAYFKEGITAEELLNNDLTKTDVNPILAKQTLFANDVNSQFGYPVINCSQPEASLCKIIAVEQGSEVIFQSDGYPFPVTDPSTADERLFKLVAEDPLCINKLSGTKGVVQGNVSFDDRSWIRFTT